MKKLVLVIVLMLLFVTVAASKPMKLTTDHYIKTPEVPPEDPPEPPIEQLTVSNIVHPQEVVANEPFDISYDVHSSFVDDTYVKCAILQVGATIPVVDFWNGLMVLNQTITRDYTSPGIDEPTTFEIFAQHWDGVWYIDQIVPFYVDVI